METGEKVKKNTGEIMITLKLRGEPAAVVRALAHGLPVEALEGIRGGMVEELEKRKRRPAKGPGRVAFKGRA
jgi:hypothetical protein